MEAGKLPLPLVVFLMVLTSLMIAGSFVVGAEITNGLAPSVLTLVRFLLAVVLFAPWIAFRFGWRGACMCSWALFWRCGSISFCLVSFFIGMFHALRFTSALNASVLYTLIPAMSALLSFLLVGEKSSTWRVLALFIGLFGAVWVIFQGDLRLLLKMQWGYGDAVFVGACLIMSFYTPLLKFFYRGEPMEVITYWILVTGAVWLCLYAGPELFATTLREVGLSVWVGIFYLTVFSTILSFYCTQLAIPVLGPTRVIAFSYSYPALVLLIELCFGHDLPPSAVFPGVILVCVSMMMLMREEPKTAGGAGLSKR